MTLNAPKKTEQYDNKEKAPRTKKNVVKALRNIFQSGNKPLEIFPIVGKGYQNERNAKGNLSPNVLILHFFASTPNANEVVLKKILSRTDNLLKEENVCVLTFIPNLIHNRNMNDQVYMADLEEYDFQVNKKNYLGITEECLEQYCSLLIKSINLLHPNIILVLGMPLSSQLHRAFTKCPDKACIFSYDFHEKFKEFDAFQEYCLNKNITTFCIDDRSFFDDELNQLDEECIDFLKKEMFHPFYSIISDVSKEIMLRIERLKYLAVAPKKERTVVINVYTDGSKKKTKEKKVDLLVSNINQIKDMTISLQKLTVHALNRTNSSFKSQRLKADGTPDCRYGKGKSGQAKKTHSFPTNNFL